MGHPLSTIDQDFFFLYIFFVNLFFSTQSAYQGNRTSILNLCLKVGNIIILKALPEKQPLPRSKIFAESKNAGSRQRKRLPRAALGKHQPSATDRIAVGLPLGRQQLSAKWAVLPRAALGKKCPSAKRSFAVGRPLGKIRLSAKHCRGP